MRSFPLVTFLLTGLLLLAGAPRRLAAQGLPARTVAFNVTGTDSASGRPVAIRLIGKSMAAKGRQYAGTCSVKPLAGAAPSKLSGEWQLVQNSSPALAGGARPAIAGIGTRPKSKPLRPGQQATGAGQVVNFTIESRPDGQYEILLMDAFTDEAIEFIAPAAAGK